MENENDEKCTEKREACIPSPNDVGSRQLLFAEGAYPSDIAQASIWLLNLFTARYRKLRVCFLFLLISIVIYSDAIAKDCNENAMEELVLESFYASALHLNKVYIARNQPEKSIQLIETMFAVEPNENCTKILAAMIFDVVKFYGKTNEPLAALESSALLENLDNTQIVLEERKKIKEYLRNHRIQESPDTSAIILE